MDQAAGAVPVFQITFLDAAMVDQVSADLAGVVAPRFEIVAHSRSDLVSLKNRIWADRSALADAGIIIQSAALDIRNNRVELGVVGLTPTQEVILADRYDGVEVIDEAYDDELDACNGVNDCYPMKGGLRIKVLNHPDSQCTSGFNVRRSGTSTFRVLTAGHCLSKAPGGIDASWMHHGVAFGTGRLSTWAALANADAGLVSQSEPSGADNLMFASHEGDIRTVAGYVSADEQNVGDYVCRQGEESGYWCGYIINEDKVKHVDGLDIEHQWVVDFDASPGDSGGPYFLTWAANTYAFGIHSDSTALDPPGDKGWYSPISRVLSVLNNAGYPVVLCTDSTCGL